MSSINSNNYLATYNPNGYSTVPRLIGDHIDLCTLRSDDAAILLYTKWMNDPELNWYIGQHVRVAQYNAEVEWANKKVDESREYRFNINEKKDTGYRLIGNCSFTVHKNGLSATLGICIGEKDCWNKHYGQEAIKMMINYGFKELNLHRMALTVCADNPRARSCYEKCGLIECGTDHETEFHDGKWRDLVHMEILNPNHNHPENK